MSLSSRTLHSYHGTDEACALYTTGSDIVAGQVMVGYPLAVQADGTTLYADTINLTAGETSNRTSRIRFIRNVSSTPNTFAVCTSSRITNGTLIEKSTSWNEGFASPWDTTISHTFYSQRFWDHSLTTQNLAIKTYFLSTLPAWMKLSYGLYVYVDGTLVYSTHDTLGSYEWTYLTVAVGSRSIRVLIVGTISNGSANGGFELYGAE